MRKHVCAAAIRNPLKVTTLYARQLKVLMSHAKKSEVPRWHGAERFHRESSIKTKFN